MIKKLQHYSTKISKSKQEGLHGPDSLLTELIRSIRIFYQYMRGYVTFRKVPACVTVFGSSKITKDHAYYQLARAVGQELAAANFTVMSGGGPGIMEAINLGAKEKKGYSIGSKINIIGEKAPNNYLDKWITFKYFFVRKMMMTKYSVAFIALPGGFGTLDELFEILTLIQTGKIESFPVILMGEAYWQPLIDFLTNTMLTHATIKAADIKLMYITDSPQMAVEYIKKYRAP